MKLYAPAYSPRFACIADRCRHSCCIGWEIDIDADTQCRYQRATAAYADTIRQSISHTGGTPHFRLDATERCPHLNEQGLCRIILSVGEEYLCEICREHPRFYHQTTEGLEVGIGMACEEACRIILSEDSYDRMIPLMPTADELPAARADSRAHRTHLYAALADASLPYDARLQAIREEYGISLCAKDDPIVRELLASLEYMDEAHRTMYTDCYTAHAHTPDHLSDMARRALAYLIYRHCSDCRDEEELHAALGFCLLCERLLVALAIKNGVRAPEEMVDYARAISEELEYSEENTAAIMQAFR